MIRACLLLSLFAGSVEAQDAPLVFDVAPVGACYAAGPSGEAASDCIGVAATACMEASPDGQTTAGMATCTSAESDEWDRLLNVEYTALRPLLAARDTSAAGDSASIGIGRADALRDAQRAWIAFRDAECHLRYALDQEGTIRMLTGTNCILSMTARRALDLRDLRKLAEDKM